MTHVHAPVLRSNSEIAERARGIHPLKFTAEMLLTLIGFPFTALGFVAGFLWFAFCFSLIWGVNRTQWLAQCAQVGFYKGARYKFVPKNPG